MSPQRQTSVRIDDDIMESLKAIHVRDGIPQSEQIRRALRAWIEERGRAAPEARTARKRVQPRKQA